MDIVLGAGIVGVSIALQLQSRGRDVTLVDRADPGLGTSFGNAGLIECSDLMPRVFPRKLSEIFRYGLGQDVRVQLDTAFMPRLMPWIFQYWWNSSSHNVSKLANSLEPLFLNSLASHKALMEPAKATHLMREEGWISLSSQKKPNQAALNGVNRAKERGLRVDILDSAQISRREPQLQREFGYGVHWRDAASLTDPAELTRLLAQNFVQKGGRIYKGDANSLDAKEKGWVVTTSEGQIEGENAVLALGPWSDEIARRFGYRFPLAVKRGYHTHYEIDEALRPKLPVVDMDNGFVLSPMANGMRLTTAIEFAHRDRPAKSTQLERVEPIARQTFALGQRLDATPWIGSRPCTADMLPIIGPAPNHKGLWFSLGHGHHGLTLAPITGQLLAEQMLGEKTFAPHEAFLPARFC